MAGCPRYVPVWLAIVTVLMAFVSQSEAYSIRISHQDSHEIILQFMYERRYRHLEHAFKIHYRSKAIFECSIFGDRGELMYGGYFQQVIQMATEHIYKNSKIKMPATLTAEMYNTNDHLVNGTVQFRLKRNILYKSLAKMRLQILNSGKRMGDATISLADPKIPKVSRRTEIVLMPSGALKMAHSFRFEFRRIDEFATNLCPTRNLGGKINLGQYIALDALKKCEFNLRNPLLVIRPFLMPFGYIEVIVFLKLSENWTLNIHRYFYVRDDGVDPQHTKFYRHTEPSGDEFSWPVQTSLLIRTSKSFFPFTHESFGLDTIYKPIIRHQAACQGNAVLCRLFTKQSGPNRMLSGTQMTREKKKHKNKIRLHVSITWTFQFYKSGKAYKNNVEKTVVLDKFHLRVDIKCVRNCLQRYAPAVPGIMRADCSNCYTSVSHRLEFKWETFPNTIKVEGVNSRFLTILDSGGRNFKLKVTVTNRKKPFNKNANRNPPLVRSGFATKTFYVAEDDQFLWFRNKLNPVYEPKLFNTFDVTAWIRPPLKTENAAPMITLIKIESDVANERLEVCSYTSPYQNLAIRAPNMSNWKSDPPVLNIGIQTAGGKYSKVQKTFPPAILDLSKMKWSNLGVFCQDSLRRTNGLSGLVAIAQEMHDGKYSYEQIRECYNQVKNHLVSADLHPGEYKNSFYIQHTLFTSVVSGRPTDDAIEALSNMDVVKDRIFENRMESTKDFFDITRFSVEAVRFSLQNPPSDHYMKINALEKDHVERLLNSSMALLRLHETRDKWHSLNFSIGSIQIMWTDVERQKPIVVIYKSLDCLVKITVPRTLFLQASDRLRIKNRQDNFVNIVVYVTGRAYFLTEGLRLNYGFVKIFAETKTEHQRLTLTPKDDPIVIEFEKFRRKKKVLSPHLYVIEENDVVIDSTCVLFSVLQSELYNLTMTLELSGNYNYSFAAILAKYPSEFIRFAEIKFERIGKNTSFFVPRVSHMHKFRYPLSRAMFMVRVPPTPASHRARARAQAARADPRQSSSRQSGTSRNVTAVKLQIQVLNSQCYYHSRGKWRSDGNCEIVHIGEHNKMKCRCHVDAPFAAQKVSALSSLILFNPNAINYHGPTVIPGIFVLMCLLIFLYYAYWSYFQDIRERNNAQTHVIQDMYNPSSADQYLVCISTGVLPGSGTDANVGFLLVGELGSHKFVVPEGSFCYSTGSDLWFMLSSDLDIGNIMGVTIKYDRYVRGSNLYPWVLRGVVLYSMKPNHVITFTANTVLGVHMSTIELPTVPHVYRWGGETYDRFWRLMRGYHSLGSVVFHRPGTGVTNVLTALIFLCVVSLTCAFAIEMAGAPKLVHHLNVPKERSTKDIFPIMLHLASVTFCASLILKSVYALCFLKGIKVMWYEKPQPIEGYWQGGTPSKSWLDLLVRDNELSKKNPEKPESATKCFESVRTSEEELFEAKKTFVHASVIASAVKKFKLKKHLPTAQVQKNETATFATSKLKKDPVRRGLIASAFRTTDTVEEPATYLSFLMGWRQNLETSDPNNSSIKSPDSPSILQESPRILQESSRSFQESPRILQESPRSFQESPRNKIQADENENRNDPDEDGEKHSSNKLYLDKQHLQESRPNSRMESPFLSRVNTSTSNNESFSDASEPRVADLKYVSQNMLRGNSPAACTDLEDGTRELVVSSPTSRSSYSRGNFAYDASDEDSSLLQARHNYKARRKLSRFFSKKRPTRGNVSSKPADVTRESSSVSYTEIFPELDYRESPTWRGLVSFQDPKRKAEKMLSAKLNPLKLVEEADCFQRRAKVDPKRLAPSSLLTATTQEDSNHIMSFRDFYFRPVLHWKNARRQVCTATSSEKHFRFLRKSRYLEKMVKEYDLGEEIYAHQVGVLDTSSPLVASSDTGSEEINSLATMDQNTVRNKDEMLGVNDSIDSLLLKTLKQNEENTGKCYGKYRNFKRGRRRSEASLRLQKSFCGLDPSMSSRAGVHKKPKHKRKWFEKIRMHIDRLESAGRSGSYEEGTTWEVPSTCGFPCQNKYRVMINVEPTDASTRDSQISPQQAGQSTHNLLTSSKGKDSGSASLTLSSKDVEPLDLTFEDWSKSTSASVFSIDANSAGQTPEGPLATLKRKALAMFAHVSHQHPAPVSGKERKTRSCTLADTISDLSEASVDVLRGSPPDDNGCRISLCFSRRKGSQLSKVDENRSANPQGLEKEIDTGRSFSPNRNQALPISTDLEEVSRSGSTIFMPLSKTLILGSRSNMAVSAASLCQQSHSQDSFREIKFSRMSVDEPDEAARMLSEKLEDLAKPSPEKSKPRGRLLAFKNWEILYSVYSLIHFIIDFFKALWGVKIYLLQIPLLVITISTTIFSIGWVIINGNYYSLQESFEWLIIVLGAFAIDILLLEPATLLCCATFSSHVWQTPSIIDECIQRFSTVARDHDYKRWMENFRLADRRRTCFIHTQATPDTVTLYHLHNKIYQALTRVTKLPQVTFHKGVYWLIFYTACALFLVNIQSDIFNCNKQKNHIKSVLKLPSERPINATSVKEMWHYLHSVLLPGLLSMKAISNITVAKPADRTRVIQGNYSSLGQMIITPVRIRQLRVRPAERDGDCIPLPRVRIDDKRSCNFEFTDDTEQTAQFNGSWSTLATTQENKPKGDEIYRYRSSSNNLLSAVDLLPTDGYWVIMHFDNVKTPTRLRTMEQTDWVDQYTRYILIDFSLINPCSVIASTYRITVDFKRSAPFWFTRDFHFVYEEPRNRIYILSIVASFFFIITMYNLIKEVLTINRLGLRAYIARLSCYIEVTKVVLSFIICYAYLLTKGIIKTIGITLRVGYFFLDEPYFVDFFGLGNLDLIYKTAGGFLTFTCIFQMFTMLRKIRRLLVFIRLLQTTVILFFLPLLTGLAFTFMATILFGKTIDTFSHLGISYLMVNQYFIKPRAIFHTLAALHPYLGPVFVLLLGFSINFFMVNFFIAFLNEAYTRILTTIRLFKYKDREKTRLEYVYEFLGIRSSVDDSITDEQQREDLAQDKKLFAEMKQFLAG